MFLGFPEITLHHTYLHMLSNFETAQLKVLKKEYSIKLPPNVLIVDLNSNTFNTADVASAIVAPIGFSTVMFRAREYAVPASFLNKLRTITDGQALHIVYANDYKTLSVPKEVVFYKLGKPTREDPPQCQTLEAPPLVSPRTVAVLPMTPPGSPNTRFTAFFTASIPAEQTCIDVIAENFPILRSNPKFTLEPVVRNKDVIIFYANVPHAPTKVMDIPSWLAEHLRAAPPTRTLPPPPAQSLLREQKYTLSSGFKTWIIMTPLPQRGFLASAIGTIPEAELTMQAGKNKFNARLRQANSPYKQMQVDGMKAFESILAEMGPGAVYRSDVLVYLEKTELS